MKQKIYKTVDAPDKMCSGTFTGKTPSGESVELYCTRIKNHKGPHQWVDGEIGKQQGYIKGVFTEKIKKKK